MNDTAAPFIDGAACDHAETRGELRELINPATEEISGKWLAATSADVDRAVRGARRAFEIGWRDLAPGKRADLLFAIAASIRTHAEELAQLESRNIGKPIADARDEVALGARVFEYYAGAIGKFCGQTIPVARGGFDFTLREPHGVVAAIVPWNFPFPIACWKVAPAIAAGNCVVLKPASLSPLTSLRLARIAFDAGLPAGVLQVVPGDGNTIGDALIQHPLVRKISFTGSTAIGTHIMQLAAPRLQRVSLELGGKSPNIIYADADWELAARTSPLSVFGNAGQDCCARSRIFVEARVFDRFVARFVEATSSLVVGDPLSEKTQVGPLVSRAQREHVEAFLSDTTGRILCGGTRPGGPGYFLQPAIVVDVAID
ncbi:MAG TPA: aldehyde dehydrogenase family protein, partial [Chthoniobacteraceae bacterium]|nr:aldehyde dehydrogenase family protein [Chthoniobacteraceae bacterium]